MGWQLSNKAIRELSVSRWDYYSSIIVAIISILLFVYQSIVKIQLADIMFENNPLVSTWYIALLVLFDTIVLGLMIKFRRGIRKFFLGPHLSIFFNVTAATTIILLVVMMIYWFLNLRIIPTLFFTIVIIGFVFFLLIGAIYYLIKRIKKNSYG